MCPAESAQMIVVSLRLGTMDTCESSRALADNSLILQGGLHSMERLSPMPVKPCLGVQPSFQMRAGSA